MASVARALLLLLLLALAAPAGAAVLAAPRAGDIGPAKVRKLLVVVEERTVPGDSRLLAALDKSGFAYELYEIAKSGPPGAEKIFEYAEGVILRTQPTPKSRLGTTEAQLLAEYLMSQGRLFLFGAESVFAATGTDLPVFILAEPNGTVRTDTLMGVKYDLVTHGMALAVEPGDYFALTPANQGEPILQLSGDRYAAVKGQTCSYRLLLASFQPGDLKKQDELETFIYKGLDWFFGNVMGIGAFAPDTTVATLGGAECGLYEHFPGPEKLVLLEIFATWCSTCARQLPILAEVAKEYQGELELVALSYREPNATVEAYLAQHPEITWKVLSDPRGLAGKKYGMKLLPALYLIDRERRVQYIGNFTTKETLVTEIERCLRGAEAAGKAGALGGVPAGR